MARKKHNIHYIYKTTCNVTGRWYIGMHSTSKLDDGYMGSGKRLRHSIRKYGVDNHTKEILEYCDSRELLIEAEKRYITFEMLCDNNCMNIMSGGTGGATMTGRIQSEETIRKRVISNTGKKRSEKYKKENAIRMSKIWTGNQLAKGNKHWVGRKHTEESIDLMRENHPFTKLVEMYNLEGELIQTFKSLHEAEKETGIARKYISHCCKGIAKTAGKHIWKFKI